jgi:hypothetical protein
MVLRNNMKRITKAAWERVIEKACDVANATRTDHDPMYEVYREQMLEVLDALEAEFGVHCEILDTRVDYIDDPIERRRLYMKALDLARERKDLDQVEVVLQSLRDLDEDVLADSRRNAE